MSLDEIKVTFFTECSDQMSELENGLFAISADDPDIEIVNSLFRAVHSIKGGAGAFGLDDLVSYAHVFETALDAIRIDITQATDKRIELLMRATDKLADVIAAAHNDEPCVDYSEITKELEQEFLIGSASKSTADDAGESIDFAPVPISIADMDLTGTEAADQYKIHFAPKPDLYLHGHDPQRILREISRSEDCLITCDTSRVPCLDEVGFEESYLTWTVEVKSEKTKDSVLELFEWVESDCDLSIIRAENDVPTSDSDLDDILVSLEQTSNEFSPPEQAIGQLASDEELANINLVVDGDSSRGNTDENDLQTASKGTSNGGELRKSSKTIRVESEKVDRLINLMGELVISQSMLTRQIADSEVDIASSTNRAMTGLLTLTREIQSSVMAIRAQPIKPVFMRMSRVIREICGATGKSAKLVIDGEHTEIDTTVIERLSDPLTHMIRNAIDHGIEAPEIRRELDKPEQGSIHLSASHNSGRIVVEIKDDGAGIDRARVLAKAIENGIVAEDARLSDDEIDDLIFAPGFSTADSVTDVSGRGVGMDVVRQSVKSLGGKVTITSTPTQGSVFTLVLPLTLAILDGMIVREAGHVFVLPITSVLETLNLRSCKITQIGDRKQVFKLRDNLVPVIDVGHELGFTSQRTEFNKGIALIVEHGKNEIAAFVLDSIEGQQQVVIKSLESNYKRVPSIAAATILGNGRIALILDIEEIAARKVRESPPHTELKQIA